MRLPVYLAFGKVVDVGGEEARNVISVDVNEDNVRVKVVDKAYIFETNVKSFIIGYAKYRGIVQNVKGNCM
jgi:hypothetical protein